jgi:glycosyltransferase involved in cell wall biosynthesis
MRVLPLGIPPINAEGPTRSRSRAGKKIRFCYFGNILSIKGLHVLIDAFKSLPQEKATLTIYGARTSWNEAYYNRLREQSSGLPVEFRSPFQREHLAEALKDQDVVVLPSICYESFSFVIREANHLGYPVIASRIGAIPEAIEEGVNGFLFEPGDPEDLRRCLLRFVQEPELLKRMAPRTKKVKFMDEHAAELVGIYRQVAGKNP